MRHFRISLALAAAAVGVHAAPIGPDDLKLKAKTFMPIIETVPHQLVTRLVSGIVPTDDCDKLFRLRHRLSRPAARKIILIPNGEAK